MLGGLSIRWNPCWFVPCLFALGHGVLHILPLFLGSKTLLDLLYDLVIFLRYFVFIIANIKNFSSSIKLWSLIQKKKKRILDQFSYQKVLFSGYKTVNIYKNQTKLCDFFHICLYWLLLVLFLLVKTQLWTLVFMHC